MIPIHSTVHLAQMNLWEMAKSAGLVPQFVLGVLVLFSVASWTIIFSKWSSFRRIRDANRQFLRAFRKVTHLDAASSLVEPFRNSSLAGVFEYGFSEVSRQLTARSAITNPLALERTLQLAISEEVTRLEHNMAWLATTASVSPFIGLLGTVWGIIEAFQALSISGATSMRVVGPGIATALEATAMGLFTAIPAAIFYNQFGQAIKEIGARMEDFSLEFLNLTERNLE